MLLEEISWNKSIIHDCNMILTATSRTSFWPLFSVWMALRIAGSWSPSNLTVITLNVSNCRYHVRIGDGFEAATTGSINCGINIPSTTAPITWWTFPVNADCEAPLLWYLALINGAHLTNAVGRVLRYDVLIEAFLPSAIPRAMPLEFDHQDQWMLPIKATSQYKWTEDNIPFKHFESSSIAFIMLVFQIR